MKQAKWIGGLLGLTGVTLGALGAHALKATLTARGAADDWETAVVYQLVHAVAILAVASSSQTRPWLARAAACWIIGAIFFSGSIYALTLNGPHWLWPATPLGGLAFMVGWCFVVIDGLVK
jgi:uncharacterized membrane protein YgdD (TMEM256/DUF423 family)